MPSPTIAPAARSLLLAASLLTLGSSCLKKRTPAEPVATAPWPTPDFAPTPSSRAKYGEVPASAVAPAAGIRAFEAVGKRERTAVSFVEVSGQPFTEAVRAETLARSDNPWDVQLHAKVPVAVAAGDVLLATFYFRTVATRDESAEGRTEFVMELGREPWTKSVSYAVRAGREWKRVYVPFSAGQSYQPNEASLIFRLGYEAQTIEIGGVRVENFGKQLALSDLPTTKISYAGMEPSAPWRAAAAERIEKLRKAELSFRITDRSGKPWAGAEIGVRQLRQEFGFGSAVVAQLLTSPGNDRYQALTTELFNSAVLENNLKWQPLAGDWGSGWTLDVAKAGVDWLGSRGLRTRGHVLVWPSWRNLPRSLKDLQGDLPKLRQTVRSHVRELATQMKGKLTHWDVLNEPFDNHDLMDLFGDDVMLEWFKEARAADPRAKLFINDYAILSGGGGDTPHRDHYEKTIRFLAERGAPFDGIGMQGHFGTSLTSPDDMLRILDRFAKFGKTIWITEYDIDIKDEAVAAEFTRDFYTTLFSHPSVGGILMWGFWDGAHWHNNAPLYRRDWSLKPAGQVYRDLVLRDWRTNQVGKTGAAGDFRTRGFLGSYEVTVTAAGKTKTARFELPAAGTTVALSLD